jgi:pimeloyl-ACP methyl ester carboxylesterase
MTSRITAHHPSSRIRAVAAGAVAAVALLLLPAASADARPSDTPRPTIVLVHGAWADASGWSGVVRQLQADDFRVTAFANPLRSLSGDAAYLREYLDSLSGPIVLVAHSYGGAVITNAAAGHPDVEALVYINAFAPDEGQAVFELAGPDSALSVPDPTTVFDIVPPPPTPASDLYLKQATFLSAFAAGVQAKDAAVMASAQRPVTLGALGEPSQVPAWRTIPSWFLIGTEDQIIPPSAQRSMAENAGAAISEYEAGHLGFVVDPKAVTNVILKAVEATR